MKTKWRGTDTKVYLYCPIGICLSLSKMVVMKDYAKEEKN